MDVIEKNELDDFSKLNVLLIDDNLLVHDTLKKALYDLGIQRVKCAENAYYGLRLCESTQFHVVICSFNVQSDKDGFHLLEELKFKGFVTKTTVLIFLSAETSEALVNSIVELQPDDFWSKPLAHKKVQERLLKTLQTKKQLFNIYSAIDHHNYSKVIYWAERYLLDDNLQSYHANLLRMKGEAYLNLLEFKEAESFFKELLNTYKHAWVYLGYVKALLKQDRINDIETLLVKLVSNPETRFGTHDMLAEYYIEHEDYDLAYQEIKKATALSPRNIDRNKKSWDLARLNHDHEGQFLATRNIAQQAKNSIHDSPQLMLNVIRSGIDLACSLTDKRSEKVLQQTDKYIIKLESDYDNIDEFKQQLIVAKARLHNVRQEDRQATTLVENHISLKPSPSIEDNLDKVKVFHELGMREEAISILDAIKNQISGDSLTSKVINKYVEQETIERAEIHFTPKQLNDMAVEHFEKKRMQPALDSISQALKLTPKNMKLTISLLKILIMIKGSEDFDETHAILGENALDMLSVSQLDKANVEAVDKLRVKWESANISKH
jgi:CheY-like chemotaxis protein